MWIIEKNKPKDSQFILTIERVKSMAGTDADGYNSRYGFVDFSTKRKAIVYCPNIRTGHCQFYESGHEMCVFGGQLYGV